MEVYREQWRRKEPERINKKIFYCRIIHRVRVCRVPKPVRKPPEETNNSNGATEQGADENDSVPSGKPGQEPIGEVMPEDSLWCVDGYGGIEARDDLERPSTPIKTKNTDNASKPKANDGVPRKRFVHLPMKSSKTTKDSRRPSSTMSGPITSPTPDINMPSKHSVATQTSGDLTYPVDQTGEERGIDIPAVTPTINGRTSVPSQGKWGLSYLKSTFWPWSSGTQRE